MRMSWKPSNEALRCSVESRILGFSALDAVSRRLRDGDVEKEPRDVLVSRRGRVAGDRAADAAAG